MKLTPLTASCSEREALRKELKRIMPGYKWTVHRDRFVNSCIEATGIQTSGFNRLSTVLVVRSERDNNISYTVKSSGFGRRAPWLGLNTAPTLAQALRGLQNYYLSQADNYAAHANCLEGARKNDRKKRLPNKS